MNARACCGRPTAATRRSWWRPASRGVLPGVLLILIPKCPMCIATYVALATGVGISVSTAAYLREGMLVLCAAALIYLAAKYFRELAILRRVGG